MVVRKRRKKHRLRGNRTHGKGNTKNKRGSGIRGGVGKAGSHKHKYSKYWKEFGVKKNLKAKRRLEAVNLEDVERNLSWGNEIDGKKLGFSKVLGKGFLSRKVVFRNVSVSKKAKEKIEKFGGIVE